jgi:transcription elongation factor Elf1|tara:strand:- start:2238 stop:2459 length:222 start_codon:yes stop_codon:yes gene_type:complete
MVGRKTKGIGLFDIPVRLPCPHCKKEVAVSIARLQLNNASLLCVSCSSQFEMTPEERSRIIGEHSERLEALRR